MRNNRLKLLVAQAFARFVSFHPTDVAMLQRTQAGAAAGRRSELAHRLTSVARPHGPPGIAIDRIGNLSD